MGGPCAPSSLCSSRAARPLAVFGREHGLGAGPRVVPRPQVDHVDQRPWNNHLANLEVVLGAVNRERAREAARKRKEERKEEREEEKRLQEEEEKEAAVDLKAALAAVSAGKRGAEAWANRAKARVRLARGKVGKSGLGLRGPH